MSAFGRRPASKIPTMMFLLGAQPFDNAALPPPSVEHCIMFNDFIEITLPEERTNNSYF
jgi:hypothetical protein